jgi:predicted kinase
MPVADVRSAVMARPHRRNLSGTTAVDDDDATAQMGDMMTTRPTLFLTVGLPGTGKTTEARRIEAAEQALRLTKDEWVKALYGPANPPAASDVIEGRLVDIGLRALELGINVVLDFGLWARDERSALRQAAADRGAAVELRYFSLSPAEQRRRLDRRHADEPHTTWHMSDEELAEWAAIISVPTPGELDGSEPVDDPPAGFATWDEWRAHRWPSSTA